MELFRSEWIIPVVMDSSIKYLYIGAIVKANFFKVCRVKGSEVDDIWRFQSYCKSQ